MSKYTVDVNVNDNTKKGASGTATAKNTTAGFTDPAALQKLTRLLKATLEENVKKNASEIERALSQALKDVLRGQGAQTSGIKESDINKILKGVVKELGSEVVKAVTKSAPKTTHTRRSSDDISKAIENNMTKAADKMAKVLSDKLSKQVGIKVDTKDLANALSGVMKSSLPKSTETAIRDLTTAVNSIKTATKEIGNVARVIQTMRQSGGKVDISEIGSILSSLKKVASNFTSLASDVQRAKESIASLAKESTDITKKLSSAIDMIYSSAKKTVSGVQTRAKEDPKTFTKEIVVTLRDAIKKSETLKGTALEKSITKLEGKIGDIAAFSSELSKFQATFKKEISAGKIKIEGAENIIKALEAITVNIGSLPKKLATDSKVAKEWEKLANTFATMLKRTSELVQKVKLIVDDSELKKALPDKVDIPVVFSPESKSLHDEIKSVVEKALEEAERKSIHPKVDPIVEKIELSLKQNDIASIRKNLQTLVDLKIDTSKLANEVRKSINVAEGQIKVEVDTRDAKKDLDEFYKKAEDLKKKHAKLADSLQTVGRAKDIGIKVDPTAYPLYKEKVVTPAKGGEVERIGTIRELSSEAKKIKMATEDNIKKLSSSLYNLQKQIVTTLDEQFEVNRKEWAVVKPAGIKDPSKAFKLAPGGQQWTMQIANLDRLQRAMKDFDSSVDVLISNYKKGIVEERTSLATNPTQMADLLGQWLKSVSSKQIRSTEDLDDVVREKLVSIKEASTGTEVGEDMRKAIKKAFGEGERLISLFKKTYAETEATKEMQAKGLVKIVAIPAAKVTGLGDVSFQTKYGAQRALPKFAKFETGFETLYQTLEQMKKFDVARKFQKSIKDLGVRPGPEDLKAAEKLSEEMLSAVASSTKSPTKYLESLYKGAAPGKGIELEKAGVANIEDYKESVKSAINTFNKLSKQDQTIEEFVKRMRKLNLTAYDVVKSLNKIEVKNVYDIMAEVLKGGGGLAPLKTLGEKPYQAKSVREFEKAVGELEGLMPLVEANRPRRGYHQENIVNLLTRTGTFYGEKDVLKPEEQKRLIKDLNLEINETLKRIERTQGAGKLPGGIRIATSLGIPESQAGAIEEYRPTVSTEGLKYLKTLNATNVKFYAEDLTSLAPFQQFQQAGRNISNVTNAMIDLTGKIETPKLRSEKERALLESGRYGAKGYGYNVVAELRNTAGTFEDQILISGKLAKALTTAVHTLVKPSPTGRVIGATPEERIMGTGVTEIKAGEISKVAKEYMQILGVPEKYTGRADKALIEEVQKTISVVRGETVEVQQAKLAETFLNYFGRKLTTRYGSKGVSITPTGQPENLAEILTQFSGKPLKVEPTATLGYQVAPKSLGKMASELFGKDISEDLKKQLLDSGNKFMIDIFKDVNIVSSDEAEKTKKLYDDFIEAWNKVFKGKIAIPEQSEAGIKKIREAYEAAFGEKSAFEIKPIDIRISSYGAAKRGLQTEFMESIFSNLASAGPGGVTTLKQLKQPEYEQLLKGGALATYSKALGYTGAGKTEEKIGPELFKMFGGKGDFAEALKSGDEKAVLAKRAAALEAAASFYSTVIDEFGKVRKGLVGEKFVQIIEEPTEYPEWQKGQIESGLKGAKLNLPAFSAYSTIFGEQSAIMKELQGSLDVSAKKHWEYLKALQTIHEQDSEIYQNITKGLKKVDVKELRQFEESTGVYGKKQIIGTKGELMINPRSFDDTILDIAKFPEAFKLAIPTGEYAPSGEVKKEELYIPGALARGTYPEPLLAGERGMDQVSRRLTHLVNMAKQLEEAMTGEAIFEDTDFEELEVSVRKSIGSMVQRANQLKRSKVTGPETVSELQEMMSILESALSETAVIDPRLMRGPGLKGMTERSFFEEQKQKQRDLVQTNKKTITEAMAYLVSTLSDLIIGKHPSRKEYDPLAITGLSRMMDIGTATDFAQKIGAVGKEDIIDKRIAALQRAKIDYYNELAKTAVGKSGSINELLFSRKIPAIMGKAVTAVVDKRDDIVTFGEKLSSIEEKYGINLVEQTSKLGDIAKTHSKAIKGYKRIGVPVLKQEELGVTEAFASKIPIEFTKRFEVVSGKGVLAKKPEKVDGTLLALLKFVEKLNKAVKEEEPEKQKEIANYIENELVPYIESIRFPFTGVSSIAPFKPKLIKEGAHKDISGRALEKHALIVPGVPEGLEGLSPVIDSLQKQVEKLVVRREELQTVGGSPEEIANLTNLIRDLNSAVSNIIPKYVAQAQKLDFDGDQIEIHSAKTAEARKNIEEHFERFHKAQATGDIRTQDVFMRRFLSEAAKVKTTGPYVFGEAAGAFEKKFPAGKGFEFMKSPFVTEELEYLSSREALNVLSGKKTIGDVSNVVKDVLSGISRPEEEIIKIMSQITGLEHEDPKIYVDSIMKLFETSYSDILKQVEQGIKKRLYEEKMSDVVEAQLFKIHTGPETEAMYRVHRLAETAAGFGGGLIAPGGKSSEYFKQRFPSTKATAGAPEEEFHTMLNEILRFGIQKGMDVKHAGEKPVAGEMLSYLTRGIKGAEELWKRVSDTEDKTFSDLRDFSKDNEEAIRMRLGELPTSEVLSEAKKITVSRGGSTAGLDTATRKELIDIIIEQVGFKGFLEEFALLIEKEAVAGLIAQAETWTPEKRRKPGRGLPPIKGNIKEWAEKTVTEQMATTGIDVKTDITEAQAPLYGMRTFSASTAAEAKKYVSKFGKVAVPEEMISKLGEQERARYSELYENIKSTASNIQQELKASALGEGIGAYSDMIKGTTDALYAEQAEIEKYITILSQEGYDPNISKTADLVERVLSRKDVSSFANTVLDMKKGMKEEVERLSELAGVPGLSDTELFEIHRSTAKSFADVKRTTLKDTGMDKDEIESEVENFINEMIEKAQALKQLDRVLDVLMSRKFEGRVLQNLLPREEAEKPEISYATARKEAFQEARSKILQEKKRRKVEYATTMARKEDYKPEEFAGKTNIPESFAGIISTGNVVPVNIVGAEQNVVLNVKCLEGAGIVSSSGPAPVQKMYSINKELQDFSTKIEKMKQVVEKVKPSYAEGEPISYEKFYRPSRLAGGGKVYGGKTESFTEESRLSEQLSRLIEGMTTEKPMSEASGMLTDWGTLIHAKIEKIMSKQSNIDIERYGELVDELGGILGGTADVIEYEDPTKKKVSKVIDIKTIGAGKLDKIKKAIETTGSTEFGDVVSKVDDDIKSKLHEYFTQLNTYLKIFDETAKAEIRFYEREGLGKDISEYTPITFSFDPKRFKETMEQLASARKEVVESGGKFLTSKSRLVQPTSPETLPSMEELDESLETVKEAFERQKNYSFKVSAASFIPRKEDVGKGLGSSARTYAEELTKRVSARSFTPEDLDKYLVPPPIAEGNDVKALLTNLSTLHGQSKLYQKMKGIDLDSIQRMPKQIGEAIGKVSEEGPDYQAFIDLTNKLKELEDPKFTGKDFIVAWKMYRIAVGDFLIKQAEMAEKQMRDFEQAGDIREANQAYGTFQARTSRLQEFVRRSVGKRTDVYTEDKRFVYPGLAKAAGVYMSPEQIMKKIGEPLGDDKLLIDAFSKIRAGISGTDLKSPTLASRDVIRDLSEMDTELVKILSDSEKFGRLGPGVLEAWDFDKLTHRVTRLREALQQILKQSGELNAEQKKNIENLIKHFKNVEKLYSSMNLEGGLGYGQTGILPVLKTETPEVQKAMHARNVQSIREYFTRPAEAGGPEVGERFTYQEKIIGEAGETVKNVSHLFRKYGEETLSSGEKLGLFSEKQQDLIEKTQRLNATFSNAIRRVVMWGAASRLVYGGISYLSRSLDELAKVEYGIAELRMVMNPLQTDFARMSKSATGFAKQYGVPVVDILKSMKIFAQQGLKQEEVIDRTQTATLASNVTTLNAKDATEALTAAMKIFREEGNQSVRFLDAWSEVEARHAITAEDMANAIKKSAAAAKTAGFTFDQLNGIVAAIGATTRQSGKEVGTSLRFIMRRLFSEKGPAALAKLPSPIATLTETGELKPGFSVLSELATQWKDLTSAQKLNIAQSVGGTRQYNSLLVLMDQWDEALRGIRNSTNSKGSAERRNLEIMKTYAKQLEQTKAAATELKMEVGKIVLPAFKVGLGALKLFTETITGIPGPIKAVVTGVLLMLGAFAKGVPIIDSIAETISKGKVAFTEFGDSLSKQWKIAKFEITGKGSGEDVFGLNTFSKKPGLELGDLHSSLSKVVFLAKSAGDAYNKFLSNVIGTGEGAGNYIEKVGQKIGGVANKVDKVTDVFQLLTIVSPGFADDALAAGTQVAESFTKGLGYGIEKTGSILGGTSGRVAKFFGATEPTLFKSLAPLTVSVVAAVPALKMAYDKFQDLTKSAQDFEKIMSATRSTNADQRKSITDMIQAYDTLDDKIKDIKKSAEPETAGRRKELGTYVAPLVGMQKVQQNVTELTNQLAESNINLVVGYDKLGNAVLKSTGNFRSYLKELENLKSLQGLETEITILDKFVKDLTETEGPEKFKVIIKELAESFPVIGDLVSRNIKIAPAKMLEIAAEDINKRLNLKQKYPLSTAADEDIKKLQESLAKAREAYQSSYGDFSRIYQGVVAPSSLRGLSRKRIEELLTSPTMRKAYELRLTVDPKFKLAPAGDVIDNLRKGIFSASNIKVEDIMGKEVLTALNSRVAGLLDVTSKFTKANLETAGISARDVAKVYAGDIVTLMDSVTADYNIAGNQAIVKLKETSDGVFNWIVEYFNTKTLKIEERPFSDIEPFVDSIFPIQKIQEDLSYRMEAFNTFVAGAAAGLSGVTEKTFKKEFSLGERFFSEIPTTTLLQGNFGYRPGAGYGAVTGAESFGKDIQEFYFKPMEDLKRQTEQIEKLKLEGLESEDVTISKDMYDSVSQLLDVLKNNQVVLQFRAVFVDLMKEFSESDRILQQNISTLKKRLEVEKETSGLMKGMAKGLGEYDIGTQKVGELTSRQNLLRTSVPARKLAEELKVLTLTSENQLGQLDNIQKALVNISDVRDVAKATGAALDQSRLGDYIEKVAKEADEEGPFKELSKINTKVMDNTGATVDRLDKLLENQGDPETLEKMLSSIIDSFDTGLFDREPKKIVNALERVAELRTKAESVADQPGAQEFIIATNKALDQLTQKLVTTSGFKEGAKVIDENFELFRKDFTSSEYKQRVFSGISTEEFLRKMEEYSGAAITPPSYAPWRPSKEAFGTSEELEKIRKLQKEDGKKTLVTGKTLAKVQAAIAAASYIEKRGNNTIVSQLDNQISKVDYQIMEAKKAGKGEAGIRDLMKKREAITIEREKSQKSIDFYGTVAALSAAGVAASELAMAFGLTEKQVKGLNVAAVGTYGAMKLASHIIGDSLPESARDFEKEFITVAKKMATGETPSKRELKKLKSAGETLTEDVSEQTKKIFGKSAKETTLEMKKISDDVLKKGFEQQLGSAADFSESVKKFRAQGEMYEKYDDIRQRYEEKRAEIFKKTGSVAGESEHKTLIKEYNDEILEWSKKISKEEANKIIGEHPRSKLLGSGAYSEAIRKNFGSELESMGKVTRRGVETTAGTSRIQQALASYLAVALVDYTTKKTGEKTEISTLESKMRKQQDALVKALEEYPEAAEKVINDIYIRSAEAAEAGKASDVETITKSLVQDTEGEYKKVAEMIDNYNKEIVKSHEETAREIARIQAELADKEIRETDRQAAYRSTIEEKNRRALNEINKKYSLQNIIQTGLRGYAGEFTLPLPTEELTTQQRVYKDSSASFKNLLNTYSDAPNRLEAMRKKAEDIFLRISEEAEIINTAEDPAIVNAAKDRHKALTEQLKTQIDVIDKNSEALKRFANSYMYLDKFASSIYQLQSAIKDLNIQEAIENLPGVQMAREASARLLGGASPYAIQAVTPEEERAASKVGVQLEHLRSSRYDVEMVRILEQMRTATGQQASDLQQQLTDLPEKFRREQMVQEQQRFDEGLRSLITPFKEQLTMLEKVRTLPGLSPELSDQVAKYQKDIDTAVSKAFDIMPISDYLLELEENKANISSETYNAEKKRLQEFQSAGIDFVYRGVQPWEKLNLLENIPGSIMEAMKESTKLTSEGIGLAANVTDPIVGKLDETNAILKAIAEKEFGLTTDYLNISKYLTKKAPGGFISGPGGPKEDKIPALLSNGEYIIKADSVKKLGKPFLDFINSKGKMPKFKDGGLAGFADYLKGQRIEKVKELWSGKDKKGIFETISSVAGQGTLAAQEMMARIVNMPLETISTAFKAKEYLSEKGVSGAFEDISKLYTAGTRYVGERGVIGTAGELASGAYKALKEELGTGGVGITSTILSSLAGVGIAKNIPKVFNKPKSDLVDTFFRDMSIEDIGREVELKAATKASEVQTAKVHKYFNNYIAKKTSENPALGNIKFDLPKKFDMVSGMPDINQLKAVRDVINQVDDYTKLVPGLTDTGLDRVVMSKSIKDVKAVAGETASGAEVGVHAPNVLAKILAKELKYPVPKTGSSIIFLEKELFENPLEYLSEGYGAGRSVKHELAHHLEEKVKSLRNKARRGYLDKELNPFIEQSKKVSKLMETAVKEGGKELPTPYALKNPAEAWAESFAVGDPATMAPTRELEKLIQMGQSKSVQEKLKLSQAFGKKEIKGDILGSLEASRVEGKITDEKFAMFRDELDKMTFSEGGLAEEDRGVLGKVFDFMFGNKESQAGSYFESREAKKQRYDRMSGLIEDINEEAKKDSSDIEKGEFKGFKRYTDFKKYNNGGKVEEKGFLEKVFDFMFGNKEDFTVGKWAPATSRKVSEDFLKKSRGRGSVDINKLPENIKSYVSEKFMGISAQYDTDMFREALNRKKDFVLFSEERKKELALAKEENRKFQAREAGMVNVGFMPADYKVMSFDTRRQLVNLDNAPISYQSKYDLKELLYRDTAATTVPKTGFEQRHAEFVKAHEAEQQQVLSNLYNPEYKNYNDFPGYLGKLKRAYDVANKALNSGVASENEVKMLQEQSTSLKDAMDRLVSGENLLSSEMQARTLLALRGGKLKEGEPMALSSKAKLGDAYTGRADVILTRARMAEYDKIIGAKNSISAFYKNPALFMSVVQGKLEGKELEMAKESIRASVKAGTNFVGTLGTKPTVVVTNFNTSKVPEAVEEVPWYAPWRKKKVDDKTLSNAEQLAYERKKYLQTDPKKLDDFFKALYNRSAEVKHDGGVVHKTGMVFAEGGEVILPKGFKNGGNDFDVASMTLNSPTVKLDASELLSKLASIELKVEDKEFKVEDKEFKVEDKELKIEDKTVKVDYGDVPTINIIQPDWKVGVEMPEDTIKIDVDMTSASKELESAITTALNKANLNGANAVGAEKLDKISEALTNVNDKIFKVKTDLEDQIKILGQKNNETTNIDRRVEDIINTSLSNVKREITDIRTDTANVSSTQRQKDVYYEYKLSELEYKLNNTMNITGIGRGGI